MCISNLPNLNIYMGGLDHSKQYMADTIDIDYQEVIDEPTLCLSTGKFDTVPHDLEGK